MTATEWVLTSENVFRLWDEDVVEHCKPHYGETAGGRIEVDGLTIWADSSATGERVWARFGDTIRHHDGRWTVTSPTGEAR